MIFLPVQVEKQVLGDSSEQEYLLQKPNLQLDEQSVKLSDIGRKQRAKPKKKKFGVMKPPPIKRRTQRVMSAN